MKSGVGSRRWVIVGWLAVGCAQDIVDDAVPETGADAGSCPEYEPDDAGVVVLMRGCPLTIEYGIK